MAVVVKTTGIPFWLVGEFTTHFRTYFLVGIEWDVHWGYDLDFDPWPCVFALLVFQGVNSFMMMSFLLLLQKVAEGFLGSSAFAVAACPWPPFEPTEKPSRKAPGWLGFAQRRPAIFRPV